MAAFSEAHNVTTVEREVLNAEEASKQCQDLHGAKLFVFISEVEIMLKETCLNIIYLNNDSTT